MLSTHRNPAFEQSLQTLCGEIAGRSPVAGACECGESVYSARPESHDLLLIIEDYTEGLRYHTRRIDAQPVTVLAADKSLVELDARKGAMGEFIVERLLTPFRPLLNTD